MRHREFISRKTRNEFREFLVGWTLREIENEFSAVGLKPDLSHDPRLGGQRREFVEQHYYALDFTDAEDVERLLHVYEAILERCELDLSNPGNYNDSASLKQQYDNLLRCLGRDGYVFKGGRLRARGTSALLRHLSETAVRFDADYMASQVDRLAEAVEQDSDLAVGQAKELVETCCRTILAASDQTDHDRLDLISLVRRTMKYLQNCYQRTSQRPRGAPGPLRHYSEIWQ